MALPHPASGTPANIGGNVYNKYGSGNPIVRILMAGFFRDLDALVRRAAPRTLMEAGCGEGEISARLMHRVEQLTAFDVDAECVDQARARLVPTPDESPPDGPRVDVFGADLLGDLGDRTADLVLCCEVLEHVSDPVGALDRLAHLTTGHVILSVPREPLWRVLNVARLRYLRDLGNTPGHVQHWSSRAFETLVAQRFRIVETRRPIPWTMVLAKPL
ncbi:class I SAM-dependent methyltransferase [Roseospira visakhapatnamensis]|uniref:2-polyprenyl-3-methyl-5-hydroxy-6-metoxy-1, 4-benzoquinol methylase n=1 Tax=Roseospira visakhapatnamensis TaxID=390880 RepID=A0A7W6W950_9PROT|nr:methyltransferase domain-containing protein [Roseospira visakhapatnamensis]MBB4265730.1 2-polyprenyl-3-methyl-5-hydroxy-6-metoxy-1,4-benzoquinol methylase [Roseospira visakhapatnamensis]